MVSAQFVSLEALEIPYYVALLGAGSLAIHSRTAASGVPGQISAKELDSAMLPLPVPTGVPAVAAVASESWSIDDREFLNRRYLNAPEEPVTVGVAEKPLVFGGVRTPSLELESRDWRDRIGTQSHELIGPDNLTEDYTGRMVMN